MRPLIANGFWEEARAMSVSTRAELHELVEDLPESDLDRARQARQRLRGRGETVDSLEWLLDNAPIEDEPTTPEEEAAVAGA